MDDFELIFAYTREQAIEDGVLIDVSKMATEAGIKLPVAVTEAVWNTYINWDEEDSKKQTLQDLEGRLWDVLYMLKIAILKLKNNESQLRYQLSVVPRDGKSTKAKLTTLKSICGPGDKGEPVITIMLPKED